MPVVASTPAPTAIRGERVAPDVKGEQGADAVRIVRTNGFIAAIEPVLSDTEREGTVIEQFPPPGVRVERETVLTLRLATTPQASGQARQSASEGEQGAGPAAVLAERDDTEEWFAGLAAVGHAQSGDGAPGRRRRKHRTPKPPTNELAFDAPPEPQATTTVAHTPIAAQTQALHPRFGAWKALSTEMGVFVARARRMPWRGMGAAMACVLCLAVMVRMLGSRRQSAPVLKRGALAAQTPTPPAKPHMKALAPPRRLLRVSARPRVPTAVHRSPRRADGAAHAPFIAPSPRVATVVIKSPDTREAPPPQMAPRHPVVNQFAYLGR